MNTMDRFLYLGVGFALGYGLCFYKKPISGIPTDSSGRPITATAAGMLIDIRDMVDSVEPQLNLMEQGRVPSPSDLVAISRALSS